MISKPIVSLCIIIITNIGGQASAISNSNLGVNQKTSVLAIPIPPNEPSPYSINASGCYKLTANMADFKVIINSEDVALFLNGFSINNGLDEDAVVVNANLSDIIIQGGEISGNNFAGRSGIRINDNCTNILITALKIRNEFNGVDCVATVSGSSNIIIKENVITNCDFGITADMTKSLRIKQNLISSPGYLPESGTTAIFVTNALATAIDYCNIIFIGNGILLNNCQSSSTTNCVISFLSSLEKNREAIYIGNGSSNIVDNCILNSLKAIANGDLFGIWLDNEEKSCIRNCLVNYIFPAVGNIVHSVGIRVTHTFAPLDYCVVQDNIVENIIGNHPTNTSYGYELLDTTTTPTTSNFINNRAVNCFSPVVPYSSNIIRVVSTPQADDYLWNWIIP